MTELAANASRSSSQTDSSADNRSLRRHACGSAATYAASADSYRDDHGAPGTLHQRLVTGLGRWLDAQEVRWSWRNHSDGILHDHHDGLAGLALLDA